MTEVADDLDVKAALRAQLSSVRRKESGSVKGRKRSEKSAMLSADDGRLTHRGETAQLNVNVQKEWKIWISRAKRDYDLAIFEIIERGLELVRAELEQKQRGRHHG
jgi:hypothetical protein